MDGTSLRPYKTGFQPDLRSDSHSLRRTDPSIAATKGRQISIRVTDFLYPDKSFTLSILKIHLSVQEVKMPINFEGQKFRVGIRSSSVSWLQGGKARHFHRRFMRIRAGTRSGRGHVKRGFHFRQGVFLLFTPRLHFLPGTDLFRSAACPFL